MRALRYFLSLLPYPTSLRNLLTQPTYVTTLPYLPYLPYLTSFRDGMTQTLLGRYAHLTVARVYKGGALG